MSQVTQSHWKSQKGSPLSLLVTGYIYFVWSTRCCCSVAQVYPILWDPHELQHARLSCPSRSPRVCSNSCPLNPWYHPAISSPICPSPPVLNLSQPQGIFQWVGSLHQVHTLRLQINCPYLKIKIFHLKAGFPAVISGHSWPSTPISKPLELRGRCHVYMEHDTQCALVHCSSAPTHPVWLTNVTFLAPVGISNSETAHLVLCIYDY